MQFERGTLLLVTLCACGNTALAPADAGGPTSPDAVAVVDAGPDAVSPEAGGLRQDSGSSDATPPSPEGGSLPPPTNHRPTAVACSTTRPPANDPPDAGPAPPGFCNSDSQCTASDAGTNGRCLSPPAEEPQCTYDSCAVDVECAGSVCECGVPFAGQGRYPNQCVPRGTCTIDSDCGAGGFCSPTFGPCGGQGSGQAGLGPPVLAGYYCHTPLDACTNDDQCPGTNTDPGFCAWQPLLASWACTKVELAACTG